MIDPANFEEGHFPARAGDWMATDDGRIAKIKRIYRDSAWDGHPSEFLVDLIIFDKVGNRIGRASPQGEKIELPDGTVFRGPRTFEPACSLANWFRIDQPVFPIRLIWVSEGGFRRPQYDLVRKNWGNYCRRVVIPVVQKITKTTDYDPELERRAHIYAAQIIRDLARELNLPILRERAEQLEAKARE